MLNLERTNRFKKDVALQRRRGKNLLKLTLLIKKLVAEEPLEEKHRNHKLKGNYVDHWECHIESDWLLIYKKTKHEITLERTGSHSDLFE